MSVGRYKVENFLYREARLMDEHAYDEWLALWTDDALYWVPCNEDDFDPERHVSIVYENKARLEDRIARLKSGAAYAQDPKSRLSRIVSNVEIEDGNATEVIVHSTFNGSPHCGGAGSTFLRGAQFTSYVQMAIVTK